MVSAALESYLSVELDSAVTGTTVLGDGLNLNLAISTEDGEDEYVLRRPNKLRHTALFNDLRREYDLLQRLVATPIPAPEPVLYCDDESVFGDPFVVTMNLEGAVVPLGSDLPERFRTPRSREHVAALVVDTLAEIHSVAVEPFDGVCDRHTPLDQVRHAIERLDEATAVTGHDVPALRSVAEWLLANPPEDPQTTLVHGDYRPGNVMFAGDAEPSVSGVLDWETAMLGDPLTELGYLLLRWRDEGDPTPSVDDLEARHPDSDAVAQLKAANERGLAPFTAKPGSPGRRELVERYEAATGFAFENDRFYRAHAALMLATVWEDLDRHRVTAGKAPDRGPHIEYVARLADSIVSGEFAL